MKNGLLLKFGPGLHHPLKCNLCVFLTSVQGYMNQSLLKSSPAHFKTPGQSGKIDVMDEMYK